MNQTPPPNKYTERGAIDRTSKDNLWFLNHNEDYTKEQRDHTVRGRDGSSQFEPASPKTV